MSGLQATSDWLASTQLSVAIASRAWTVPTLQSIHILSIAIVMASVALLDLRLAGLLGRARSLRGDNLRLYPWSWGALAVLLILTGLCVEILMPVAILTGTADRAAGLILAGYCMVTALLWKQFWRPGDFWRAGDSRARDLFWDFLKNFSLAGGFLLITVGSLTVSSFLHDPFSSTHPYAAASYRSAAGLGPKEGS